MIAAPGTAAGPTRDPITLLSVGWAIRWFGLSTYTAFVLIYLNVNLHLPYLLAGLLLAVPNVAGLVFPLLGGGLADRFGRRTVMVSSFGGETLGLAVLAAGAFLGALPVVLGALVLTRAAGTLGNPAVTAYVTDLTIPARRAQSQAKMRTALNAGFTGGTLAGGAALSVLSFGELAGLTAIVTLIGVVVTVALVPPSPYDQRLRALGGVADPAPGTASGGTPRRGVRATYAASLEVLYRDRALLLVWAAACATWTLNQQISYAVPTYAHSGLGLSFALVGIALALNAAIVVVAQLPLTRIVSGRRMTVVGTVGALAYVVAFVGIGIVGVTHEAVLGIFLALVVVLTFGECAVFYPVSTLSMNLASAESRGAYSGAMQMSAGVGAVLAPLLAGVALGGTTDPILAWTLLALPAVAAVILLSSARAIVPRVHDTA